MVVVVGRRRGGVVDHGGLRRVGVVRRGVVLLLVAGLGRGGRVQGLEVHDLHVVREALRVKVMGISLNWQS